MKILTPQIRKEGFTTRKFIDYDKYDEIFYDNLYLDDFKLCVKIPLICKKEPQKKEIVINRFNLERYTYILSY